MQTSTHPQFQPLTVIDRFDFVCRLGPSVNEAYPDVIRQPEGKPAYIKRVSSKKLDLFQQEIGYLLIQQGHQFRWDKAGRIGVSGIIYVTRSNADHENYQKAYHDAVCPVIGVDDSHIWDYHYRRGLDPRNPRIEATWFLFE